MEKYDVEVNEAGTVRYFKKGTDQLHRLDGPAVVWCDGTKSWYQNGERHRLDGPVIEYADGTKFWYQNDNLHRLDGPAIEYADGTNVWFQDDNLHRLDGPAIEYADGTKFWYIDGVKFTETQFNAEIASLNTKEMTIAEIEALLGHSVKIVK